MNRGERPTERPHVAADPAALAAFAAAAVAARIRARAAERGRFDLVLSGGTTPGPVYEALAESHAGDVPWDRVHVWYADERCVPPDDPASNHGAVEVALLGRVALRPPQVHRVRGEDAPGRAADLYEEALRDAWPRAASPEFDLVLLGIGTDGHTASLFPGSPVLEERVRWVSPARSPAAPHPRVTLTLPGLAGAREVVFLVTGGGKRPVLAEILRDPVASAARYPAARLAAMRSVAFWADAAAAGVA